MNTPGPAAQGSDSLELPPFSLDVQALDLGEDVKAVGLELVETENREPVRGKDAAEIWSAVFRALAGDDSYAVDFFSHLERVREFCKSREIAFRDAAERCVVLPQPTRDQLRQIFERFEGETFGIRAGKAAQSADAAIEADLSKRGMDAYQPVYGRYAFCAICEPEDGWVTLLSNLLWPSEVIAECGPRFSHLTSTLRGPIERLLGRGPR
jgi:hypothetical protein